MAISDNVIEYPTPAEAATAISREPAFLTSVRLRAQRYALWLGSRENAESELPATVDRCLRDPAMQAAREDEFYRTDSVARSLTRQIGISTAEWNKDRSWQGLRQVFALSDFEVALLASAIAADTMPELRRAYASLHNDPEARYPSRWLVSRLFPGADPASLNPQCPLIEWRLARVPDGTLNPWAAHAPWVADAYIMLWLAGESAPDAALAGAVECIPRAAGGQKSCLFPELLEEMLDFLREVSQSGPDCGEAARMQAVEIELAGPPGSGKRTLAAQFAAQLGADLLVVDADRLLAETSAAAAAEKLQRAVRMARLSEAILYWDCGFNLSLQLWQAIGSYGGVMLFRAPDMAAAAVNFSAAKSPAIRRLFELPVLRHDRLLELWGHFTNEPAPTPVHHLTIAADVERAAQVASAGPDAVARACQESFTPPSGELFTPLPCPFTWEDIVLLPALRAHLGELEEQIRLRPAVYEDWGFERLCPMGRGISAMFCGPSGTGKTMAAQVLARSLGVKLLRVDLAGVMNKYIGETEKRLKQVFDSCERSNIMLFFDEADALFGQRTQVKSSQDRFANIEIDYLLQRMEQFDGVAILATNRKGDLDKAFVRRLRFILDFYPPGLPERKALWRRALHSHSPSGEEILGPIDWDFLAFKLNMTGADIASAALSAAFLARSQQQRIQMHHVLQAARRELAKHGHMVRPGEWEGTN